MESTIENITPEEKLEPLSEEEKAELSELLQALDANIHELDADNRYGWPIVQRFGERAVPYILATDQNNPDRNWFTMEFLNTVVTEKTAPLVLKSLQENKIDPFYGALAAAKGREKTADALSDLLLDLKIPNPSGRSDHLQILSALASTGAAEVAPKILRFYELLLNNTEYRRYSTNSDAWLYCDANAVVNALVKIGGPVSQGILKHFAENGDERIKNYAQEAIDGRFQAFDRDDVRVITEPRPQETRNERVGSYEDYDSVIERGYKSGNFIEVNKRLDVIRNLREELRKEAGKNEEPEEDVTKFLRKHYLEYREENPSPYTPTLGIEIEIRKSSLENPPQTDKEETKLREKYSRTEKLGIPYGLDTFWEFAHRPAFYYQTLSREAQALIEMGLINKENTRHPLHLTLGGIEKEENEYTFADAYLLLRALEATRWSIKGGRLIRPYLSSRHSWNIKGESGVMNRHASELEHGFIRGIELRTFQLQSITGLDRILRSAFLLGAALKSFQELERQDVLADNEKEEVKKSLADIWSDFSFSCANIFEKYGLPNPLEFWLEPEPKVKSDSGFFKLAELLDQSEIEPESQGASFVAEMRELIIKSRAKVAKIIYSQQVAEMF